MDVTKTSLRSSSSRTANSDDQLLHKDKKSDVDISFAQSSSCAEEVYNLHSPPRNSTDILQEEEKRPNRLQLWWDTKMRWLAIAHPNLHSRLSQVVLYVRGPRPIVDSQGKSHCHRR